MGILKFIVDYQREQEMKSNFEEAQKNRPKYEISDELNKAYGESWRQYEYGDMPGYADSQDRVALSAANAAANARESGGLLGAIPAIQAAENRGNRDLSIANARFRSQNLDRAVQMSMAMNTERGNQFQLNEFAPWADRLNFDQQMTTQKNQRWTELSNSIRSFFMSYYGGPSGASAANNLGNSQSQQNTDLYNSFSMPQGYGMSDQFGMYGGGGYG